MNISSSQQSFGTKHLKHPVKSIVYMPPANIIVYISLSDLLLFMVFIKRKTIEKYKKMSFLGQIWGKNHDNNKQ